MRWEKPPTGRGRALLATMRMAGCHAVASHCVLLTRLKELTSTWEPERKAFSQGPVSTLY